MTVGSKFKKFASYEDETRDIIPFRNWSVLRKETHMSKIILKYAFWGKNPCLSECQVLPQWIFPPQTHIFFFTTLKI